MAPAGESNLNLEKKNEKPFNSFAWPICCYHFPLKRPQSPASGASQPNMFVGFNLIGVIMLMIIKSRRELGGRRTRALATMAAPRRALIK